MMQNDAAKLYCPNDLCRAPNNQTDNFCQQCGTPMVKRYLWAVGEGIEACKPGNLWRDRYLLKGTPVEAPATQERKLKSHRVFLDTKPGWPPETLAAEIPDQIKHYLRLIPYRLNVPQIYAVVPAAEERTAKEILLLDQAPIYPDGVPLAGQLMPKLTDAWGDATSMRQLNWLWQIAHLWLPLATEGVASSLLEPELLRVEGSLVRLLELLIMPSTAPTLASLGQLWLPWVTGAKPAIARFLEQLCQALIQGEVQSCAQLIAILDRGLAAVGQAQTRTLTITTHTDAGPSRQRNEDACYPPSGTTSTQPEALVIVCDGVGGHEGGNVASSLAIETIQQQLQHLLLANAYIEPKDLLDNLEGAACEANDQISQRNDSEHRHGRQRMGTTLVMGLGQAHEIYITHVGDSRAYWIMRTGCHQVTLDDDVASREVRLGYSLYQDALQQASSGSLVQALGMSPSTSLHPTVQRFVPDEDCVFLLCSDGLSDYDRVEQFWEAEILPVLNGKDLASVGARMIDIANTQNGHDNVTVGLVYCQVSSSEPDEVPASLVQQVIVSPGLTYPTTKQMKVELNDPLPPNVLLSTIPTQQIPPPSRRPSWRSFLPVLLGIILLSLVGVLLARFSPKVPTPLTGSPASSPSSTKPTPSSTATPVTSPTPRVGGSPASTTPPVH